MMNGTMENDMGEMMWGMGFVGFLVLSVLILCIVALVKYIFFSAAKEGDDQ